MTTKKKSPARRQELNHNDNKDTKVYRIKAIVKSLFESGRKLTAREINRITQSNDARKVISTLRSEGWNIQDVRLPDNRKLYWLSNPVKQLSFLNDEL